FDREERGAPPGGADTGTGGTHAGANGADSTAIADTTAAANAAAADAAGIRFYPGSPALARLVLRPQDRMALCEKHPEEFAALRGRFGRARRVSVHGMDGYTAIRAMLPPPEKRALVLLDPPFEERGEFARITSALAEGLRRAPGATFAVWYPLTERAQANAFLNAIAAGCTAGGPTSGTAGGLAGSPTVCAPAFAAPAFTTPPFATPAFAAELTVAGADSPLRMRGCGVAVLNPPWRLDRVIAPMMRELAALLAQGDGGAGGLRWLAPEKP
ncbi:MAG: 23S rRNA (adenine(2030)-N(6))-methyltransferase RlmJ, partial [Opitutaceae bacterium]|nr:23S rRNA (adenine(2030)-N(6))-methyltransferase RlmJ [Opitutaceae bacterium]